MEITAQVLKELELFNRGRTSDKGVYLIRMATEYRPYFPCGVNFLLLILICLSVRWE